VLTEETKKTGIMPAMGVLVASGQWPVVVVGNELELATGYWLLATI
jgi:hypothetical protein